LSTGIDLIDIGAFDDEPPDCTQVSLFDRADTTP